jgi:hypothetical protein
MLTYYKYLQGRIQWRTQGGSGVSTDTPQRIGEWLVLCELV